MKLDVVISKGELHPFVGVCLQRFIAAHGETRTQVREKLEYLVEAYRHLAQERDESPSRGMDHIDEAPKRYWKRWRIAAARDRIQIEGP